MNLQEIFAPGRSDEQIIDDLKYKAIPITPWSDLKKEYDVKQHPVMTDLEYNQKTGGDGEEVSHVTFGWQKLAVKRMSELAFGIPVQRTYVTTDDNGNPDESLNKAAQVIEAIYEKNRVNSLNLERGRELYAACEAITIWYGQKSDNAMYAGEKALYKLRSKIYSPKKGDNLYALFDDGGDLIALSVEYTILNSKRVQETYLDAYTDTKHFRWLTSQGAKKVLEEPVKIGKISGVYVCRDMPIWEDLSHLVEEAEWTISRNGNYIRKNARPTFVISSDGELTTGNESKSSRAARNVIRVGKGETAGYATWQHANDAIKWQTEQLKREFFTQLQLPDMSMDEMKTTPMSGEARKMLFIDAQMKVTDESGIWLECFSREFEVIRAHARLMFPDMADAINRLQVEFEITPFQIKDEGEKITNISNAKSAGIMSTRTAVRYLGWVDDVEGEVKQIEAEKNADVFEPTM